MKKYRLPRETPLRRHLRSISMATLADLGRLSLWLAAQQVKEASRSSRDRGPAVRWLTTVPLASSSQLLSISVWPRHQVTFGSGAPAGCEANIGQRSVVSGQWAVVSGANGQVTREEMRRVLQPRNWEAGRHTRVRFLWRKLFQRKGLTRALPVCRRFPVERILSHIQSCR